MYQWLAECYIATKNYDFFFFNIEKLCIYVLLSQQSITSNTKRSTRERNDFYNLLPRSFHDDRSKTVWYRIPSYGYLTAFVVSTRKRLNVVRRARRAFVASNRLSSRTGFVLFLRAHTRRARGYGHGEHVATGALSTDDWWWPGGCARLPRRVPRAVLRHDAHVDPPPAARNNKTLDDRRNADVVGGDGRPPLPVRRHRTRAHRCVGRARTITRTHKRRAPCTNTVNRIPRVNIAHE